MSQIEWLDHLEGIEEINSLGKRGEPFLFILSYDKSRLFAKPLDMVGGDILYKIDTNKNYSIQKRKKSYKFHKYPIPLTKYRDAMDRVIREIESGNTYLLNLTFRTPIDTDLDIKEIFFRAKSKFKLYIKDEFVCFSPECFIDIIDDTISTYPMKGTIESSVIDAKERILSDPKEMAEHIMIVDLMRNDLSIVGSSIKVDNFRYIDKIRAGEKELLQVSSHITAKLPSDWRDSIGTILDQITPVGSVTGTPKRSTIDIIDKIEDYDRGFYTGIFGIFDGSSLYSAVMIRFIEDIDGELFYKSGGGITIDSDLESEYRELIDKVYLPF
jgi:para-aminobenzoate synthetase component 1